MADSNQIWQSLLEDISSSTKTETPVTQINSAPALTNTNQISQQPTIIQGVDVSHVQPELQQFYADKVNPINPNYPNMPSVIPSVNLTELNSDVPDEYEDEDEDIEIEAGVDTEFNASFQLQLPEQPQPVINSNDPFAGLFNAINTQSPIPQGQQSFVLPNVEKRRPGRPKKIANDILNNLPTSLQDTDKSTEINQFIPATSLEGKEIILSLPKRTAREIGESFIRIGNAIIESCNSQ